MLRIADQSIRDSSLARDSRFLYSRPENREELASSVLPKDSTEASLVIGEASAVDLPFEDESFDVVMMNSVLYYVEDHDKAISEAH